MRTIPFALLSLVLSAAPIFAQSSPPAAETKGAGASASTITKDERDRAIAYLKETEKDFLAAIDKVSDAQWKFKAAPERWSIAETAEHIALAEDLIWQNVSENVMKSAPAPEKRAEVQGKDELILTKVPDRSRKAQAPEVLKPTGKFATRAELAKHFQETRAKEIAYLTDTKDDLRNHFGEHPAFKTLDGYQWIIFNGAHCKRHTAQIEEVKTDANYPNS